MPARMSEAFVLQTYPFREADLIVSFLTRDLGKLRGVARRARKPRSGFGSGLERLSRIRMSYFQRENRELVNVDSCDLVQSQFTLVADFTLACALDYIAEVSEQLLPAAEPNEKYFRLVAAVLDHMHSGVSGAAWRAITYFGIWALKLSGFLPSLNVCPACRLPHDVSGAPGGRTYYMRHHAGLYCQDCRRALDLRNAWEMSAESREIAREILSLPIANLSERQWIQSTASDLRRFVAQQIESHIERRLVTAPVLEAA
jgi:DNA repair protein RecO (recombination protein O)